MEANDIDDILQGMGISNPHPTPPSPPAESSQEESSAFSAQEITDILEENGFTDDPEVPEELPNDGEGREEEEENNEYLARQEASSTEEESDEPEEDNESHLQEAAREFEEALDEEASRTPTEETQPSARKLPLNSPTLLMDDTTTRFSGAEWFSEIQKQRIIVGGCGGIGSNLIFQLARMVPANITVYDNDTVETANMAGQLFSWNDIGLPKVDAMAGMVQSYTSMHNIYAIQERFTPDTPAGDVMMSGFDNMIARRVFFESWYNHASSKNSVEERAKCLLLDGRLSMDTLQIFCIRGDDEYNINRYRTEFLFKDYQAEHTICSMKQTTYLACMIGSLMVNLFTNFVAGQLDPIIPYDLPFFTEYDAQNMLFKTES